MPQHITAEDLMRNSSKKTLQDYWESYVARFKCDPAHHRDPETVHGFLTKEKLTELFSKPDSKYLVMVIGLILVSNDEVCFFTDDPTFGIGALPTAFKGFFINGLQHQFGKGREFEDVDAILKHYSSGERHLNSMDELINYLNKE
jgi:hypothetical protein